MYAAQPVHDVAIIALDAPLDTFEGDPVSVSVTVANQGSYAETTTVSLTDTTDGGLIGSDVVSLNPGSSTVVPFNWDTTAASAGAHLLEAEASVVTGETDTADNTMTRMVTVNQPVHDVAVTALNAPSDALEGDVVSVSVTVQNQGSFPETTTVTLTDTSGGGTIGSQVVSLSGGASTTLSFDWSTSGASTGDHVLEADASVVAGETDTADNSASTTVTINEPSALTMHVADIDMSLKTAGKNVNGVARVTISDGVAPVPGATVSAQWSGATSDSDVGITDALGRITLQSNKVKRAQPGTTFTVTITNVVKSGWTYNPAENAETSDSATVE
jgi:hypothetical protein